MALRHISGRWTLIIYNIPRNLTNGYQKQWAWDNVSPASNMAIVILNIRVVNIFKWGTVRICGSPKNISESPISLHGCFTHLYIYMAWFWVSFLSESPIVSGLGAIRHFEWSLVAILYNLLKGKFLRDLTSYYPAGKSKQSTNLVSFKRKRSPLPLHYLFLEKNLV